MQENNAANTMPVSSNMGVQSRDQEAYAHESAQLPRQSPGGQYPRQRILVVEDDATLAALEAEVLTAHGYTVVIVDSGELAIAKLRTFVPDLVVLDLELTGPLNGLDVLHALRADMTVPVLFTTSSAAEARRFTRGTGESRLTLDHLPKPYSMSMLLKRVQRLLMLAY
jgi:DNA-binding response OmpR family regulator